MKSLQLELIPGHPILVRWEFKNHPESFVTKPSGLKKLVKHASVETTCIVELNGSEIGRSSVKKYHLDKNDLILARRNSLRNLLDENLPNINIDKELGNNYEDFPDLKKVRIEELKRINNQHFINRSKYWDKFYEVFIKKESLKEQGIPV